MLLQEEKVLLKSLLKVETKLYTPHPQQEVIIDDSARFKVVACGRRFGKTTLAINELLFEALGTKEGYYWYIAPTYRQAKTIAWQMLLKNYYDLPEGLQKGKNEAELWIEVGVFSNRIELKGADNEDSLRGSGLNGIVIDEVASIKNFEYLWQEVLRPALTDKKGWGIFISTPKGFNHFYELFNKEQTDSDYKSFRFTSYQNPYLERNEIDKAKEELTEDAFAQEYLADFRKYTGLIYKEFDRNIHVIESFETPREWTKYRSMDFGANNPTVCLWLAVNSQDQVFVYDEYYNTGQKIESHAEIIKAKTKEEIYETFGDPSGEQAMLDYAGFEIYITPATKIFEGKEGWINHGIELIKQALNPRVSKPRLYIFKNCGNIIREFESYEWKETKGGEVLKDIPKKENDHAMDALRYFFVSYTSPKQIAEESNRIKLPANKFTGY